MTFVRAHFLLATIFFANFLTKNCLYAKELKKSLQEPVEQLYFWKPDPSSPGEIRRSYKKDNWLKPIQSTEKSVFRNHSQRKPQPSNQSIQSVNVPILTNATGEQKDSKKNSFGLHDGLRIRFSRNNGRQGGKEPNISSTRVAPLHLMQHEPEQPQDKENPKEKTKSNTADVLNEDQLSSYTIEEQFTQLLSEFEDADFTSEVLGRTASYINIVMFKILKKGNRFFRAHDNKFVENETKEKKIIFIVHALSPMGLGNLYALTVESYLKKLIGYYLAYLDKFDIFIIPMANPDGYIKVKTDNLWNKNFAVNAECPGVDVDRNFDVAWNSSEDISSCSQHYPGVAPFSEPESRAVRDVFHRMSHKIVAYFHVHGGTYTMKTFKGDAVLYPKGYSDQQSDDDKYIDLKGEIDEAIKNANFKVLSVTVDTLYNWYGKVLGTSVDYAATVYGIPYAMELVMQLYEETFNTYHYSVYGKNSPPMAQYALEQIWKRVIDVIFTNIHKKLEGNDNFARIR